MGRWHTWSASVEPGSQSPAAGDVVLTDSVLDELVALASGKHAV